MPRHWEWLESQPNGASAALRRLVENARKDGSSEQKIRARIEAVGRVMTVLAGNLQGFEEACRALYRRDVAGLNQIIESWPPIYAPTFLSMWRWTGTTKDLTGKTHRINSAG